MRSYEEISQRIMRRGDEICIKKAIRVNRIRQVSFATSGLCAAFAVGFSIWHNKEMKNAVHYDNIIEDIVTTSDVTTDMTASIPTSSSYSTDTTNTKITSAATHKTSITKAERSKTTTVVSTLIENKQVYDISSSANLIETTSAYETISPIVSTTVADTIIYNDSIKFMKYHSRIIDIGNQSGISNEKNVKVKLDGDYVWFVSLDELEDEDKIRKMGLLRVDFDEYSYVGEYNGEIDESRNELFYGRKYTHYTYSDDDETLYHTYITIYNVEPEKYVVKFENSPKYYLYTLSQRYYEYDGDSSELDQWSDHGSFSDEIDWNAEVVEVEDNEQLMHLFGTVNIGGIKYSIVCKYCDISEIDEGLKYEYITFNKKGEDGKTYHTEAMLFNYSNNNWIIRFNENNECWLYSIIQQ